MNCKKMMTSLTAAALCVSLAACGSTGAASGAAASSESTAAESAATSEAAPAESAAETTGSGKVTVYMPSPAGLADKLAEGFTAKTGIEVEQFQGTTGEILARLEAEQANPVADVVILASWSDGLSMKADGQLESYTPTNADKIVDGWIDADNELFGYTGEVGALVAGVDYNAYSSKAKGEPIDIYYPAGGTVVNPRPAMILKTAPNMDNAKAFVDYLFSDEAQELVAKAYLLPGRSDVKCDSRSNLEDIPQIKPDWEKMMAEASEDSAKVNELCSANNG